MSSYTWESLAEGEVPNNGDVLRHDSWSELNTPIVFVGEDCRHPGAFVAINGDDQLSGNWAMGAAGWLRRVERPHRWERWANEYEDGYTAIHRSRKLADAWKDPDRTRVGVVRMWCDADGELHIERVEVDQ